MINALLLSVFHWDAEGLINGEYGFITADGVYHETGYATDKNGDYIITKQRNRKITSCEFVFNPEIMRLNSCILIILNFRLVSSLNKWKMRKRYSKIDRKQRRN